MSTRCCVILVLSGAVTAGSFAADEKDVGGGSNVLMICVDDLRPMLGCYDDHAIRTPHIDRLAARGTVFLRAYCQSPQCGPSRVSFLTGMRPDTTGYHSHSTGNFNWRAPREILTLPLYLKRHGYHTQAFGKVLHDGQKHPESWSVAAAPGRPREMWELVDEQKIAKLAFLRRTEVPTRIMPRDDCPAIQGPDVPDETLFAGRMTSQVIQTIESLTQRPFFLAVGYRRPHLPFVAPQKYFDLYPTGAIKLPAHRQPAKDAPLYGFYNSGWYSNQRWGVVPPRTPTTREEAIAFAGFELRSYRDIPSQGPISDELQIRLRQAYMACVSYVDAQIGRLLDALDQHGLTQKTIVVLCSDHGWHLGEHGTWTKMTNYELAARVPLVVSAPLRADLAPGKTPALAELIDVYPTVCELVGLPAPVQLDGVSLVPLMQRPESSVKNAALTQYPRPGNSMDVTIMGRAIRTSQYRFVAWINQETGKTVARELYDHNSDPLETVNLADRPDRSDIVVHLEKLLSGASHESQSVPVPR